MKVAALEAIPVSVPYQHREVSSQVARDGVSDVLVKLTTDDGRIGWGESCCGADTASVEAALRAMAPFVVGRDPWNREAMRRDVFTHGLWQFQSGTGNFAWAGIDMALWDICGRVSEQPLWRLLGGLHQKEVSYFYYLARGSREELGAQVERGLKAGYDVFYLKVGLDDADDLEMVANVRELLGAGPATPTRCERKLGDSAGSSESSSDGRVRHRFRGATCTRSPGGSACRDAGTNRHRCLRQRRSLVGGRRPRPYPCTRRRCLLLLSLLGRIDSKLSPALLAGASTRGYRSASTPTESSVLQRQPAIMSF